MKKLLIIGLIANSFAIVMHAAQDTELEKKKLIGLFSRDFDEDNFNNFVVQYSRINNPNAEYERLPLLYWAVNAITNPVRYVKYLLDQGAAINNGGQLNVTALMHAADKGKFDVVEYLLQRGAKPELKNNRRQTALDLARRGLEIFQKKLDEQIKLGVEEILLQLTTDTIERFSKTISILEPYANIPVAPPAPMFEIKRQQEIKTVAAAAPKPQVSVNAVRNAVTTIPQPPAWTDQDYKNLTEAINNKLAQSQPVSIVPAATRPNAPSAAIRSAVSSIPNAPALTPQQERDIVAAMNQLIEKEAKTTQEQESKASSAVGQSPVAALNEIKAILIRNSKRPSFNQWFAKFDAKFSGKGEEEYKKLDDASQIIRVMGENENAFYEALYDEYDKASPQDKETLVKDIIALAIPIFEKKSVSDFKLNAVALRAPKTSEALRRLNQKK